MIWVSLREMGNEEIFLPHQHHCVVIYPCLAQVQPRKIRPEITEKLLTGT